MLAGGSGKRMGSRVHKQYLLMGGKPVLFYSLKAFQDSDYIDEIILVTGAGGGKSTAGSRFWTLTELPK